MPSLGEATLLALEALLHVLVDVYHHGRPMDIPAEGVIHQTLPCVSSFVASIFPPNMLGQSTFTLSESRREDWYLNYPTMRVFDTHSSCETFMQGYMADWGTTSR